MVAMLERDSRADDQKTLAIAPRGFRIAEAARYMGVSPVVRRVED